MLHRLKQIESEFFTLVDVDEIAEKFYIPEEAVDVVTEYWKLKRKVRNIFVYYCYFLRAYFGFGLVVG